MKCISHSTPATVELAGNISVQESKVKDDTRVVNELVKINQAVMDLASRQFVMPIPEFHNEVKVEPTPVHISAPEIVNKIEVQPTPIHLDGETKVVIDLSPMISSIKALVWVIGLGFLSTIGTSLFLSMR